jgi:hypothetical protein
LFGSLNHMLVKSGKNLRSHFGSSAEAIFAQIATAAGGRASPQEI